MTDRYNLLLEAVREATTHIRRAQETLNERTTKEQDTELIDVHDDVCNALDVLVAADQPWPKVGWVSVSWMGTPEVPTRWQRLLIRLKLRAPPRAATPLDGHFFATDGDGNVTISRDGVDWTPRTPSQEQ